MSTYAIGDIQGCYDEFCLLLEKIHFDPSVDILWLTGDIVNRGPKSLDVMRLVKSLQAQVITVLGNHDLHLLAIAYAGVKQKSFDTIEDILTAPDREELLTWLRLRPIFYYDEKFNTALVHAGIYPPWSITDCIHYAGELENILRSNNYIEYFIHMYGNHPSKWKDNLQSWDRLRFITNAFTRMRLCNLEGDINLTEKGTPKAASEGFIPWFEVPNRPTSDNHIIFGHWAALECKTTVPNIFAVDSGCVWGNQLTAMRLEDRQYFTVEAQNN